MADSAACKVTDEEIDELLNFKPLVNDENAEELTEYYHSMNRELGIIIGILRKDADELTAVTCKQLDLTEKAFDHTLDCIDRLQTFKELAETCSTRLMLVLAGLEDKARYKAICDRWGKALGRKPFV